MRFWRGAWCSVLISTEFIIIFVNLRHTRLSYFIGFICIECCWQIDNKKKNTNNFPKWKSWNCNSLMSPSPFTLANMSICFAIVFQLFPLVAYTILFNASAKKKHLKCMHTLPKCIKFSMMRTIRQCLSNNDKRKIEEEKKPFNDGRFSLAWMSYPKRDNFTFQVNA